MELEEFEELFGNIPINDLKKIQEYINKNFVSKDKIRKLKEKYENKCAVLDRNSNNNEWYKMGKIFGKADLCEELLEVENE